MIKTVPGNNLHSEERRYSFKGKEPRRPKRAGGTLREGRVQEREGGSEEEQQRRKKHKRSEGKSKAIEVRQWKRCTVHAKVNDGGIP